MGGTHGVTVNTDTEMSQLTAGATHEQKKIKIKASAGAMTRGTVLALNTSTYLYEQFNPAGSNGTDTPRCILAEDVADAAAAQEAEAHFLGKYREDDLVWPDSMTNAQKRAGILALQDRGIITDETFDEAVPLTTTTSTTTTTTTTT